MHVATDEPIPVDSLPTHAAAAHTTFNYHLAYHGMAVNPDTGHIAEYPKLSQYSNGVHWIKSNRDEIGCLAQGLGPDSHMPKGTDMIFFIPFDKIPKDCKATYI